MDVVINSRIYTAAAGGGPALYDNSAKGSSKTLGTSLSTGSFTVGGNNRVLYVFVGTGASSPQIPSTVKWNTTESLTQISTTITVADGPCGVLSLLPQPREPLMSRGLAHKMSVW
jgi:hypothetical protein